MTNGSAWPRPTTKTQTPSSSKILTIDGSASSGCAAIALDEVIQALHRIQKNMRPSHSSHDFFYTFVFVNQPPTTLQSEDYETLCTLPDLMPECDRCADLMFHICKNRTTGRDIFHRQHHGISGRCIHPRQHHRHHSDRRGDRRHVDYCFGNGLIAVSTPRDEPMVKIYTSTGKPLGAFCHRGQGPMTFQHPYISPPHL